MLQPKRTKYRKQQKGSNKGLANKGSAIAFGSFGLKSIDTGRIINRQSESRVRVKVDIEGYMETRKANLKHLALKMAEKAKKEVWPTLRKDIGAEAFDAIVSSVE